MSSEFFINGLYHVEEVNFYSFFLIIKGDGKKKKGDGFFSNTFYTLIKKIMCFFFIHFNNFVYYFYSFSYIEHSLYS